jgi:hypothetical protein
MTRHIRLSAIFTLGLVVFGSSCAGKEIFDSSQLVSKLKSPAITSTMASEAEKLTSKCMARQGFKYLPLKIVISGKPHEEPGIASPEFLRLHGYGISESISGEMPSVAVGPEILLGRGKDPNKDPGLSTIRSRSSRLLHSVTRSEGSPIDDFWRVRTLGLYRRVP